MDVFELRLFLSIVSDAINNAGKANLTGDSAGLSMAIEEARIANKTALELVRLAQNAPVLSL